MIFSSVALVIVLAVVIDWLLGEPKRWHPLVGFGRLANAIEVRFNSKSPGYISRASVFSKLFISKRFFSKLCFSRFFISKPLFLTSNKLSGIVALPLLCLPLALVWHYWMLTLDDSPVVAYLLEALVVYLTIGHRSLWDHIRPITAALFRQDDASARQHTAMIVSRDPETLNIEVSAIESVLENGSDAIFAAIFWFVMAGVAGAVFYRLVNTLDAMWGYRTERYSDFGWAAAKLDDVLNYLPARCTALSYAVLSDYASAIKCWKEQAPLHASPNGGPVIAAGAGGLGVLLGGRTRYHGEWHEKPVLGRGQPPNAADIQRAMWLVSQTLLLWVLLIGFADLLLLILYLGGWR